MAPAPDDSAIRLIDVYAEQVKMSAQLAVIHEQLRQLPDHEARIRVLENSRAKIFGATIALSAVVSGCGTWVGLVITHR